MSAGATSEQLREYDTLVNRFQAGGGYEMDVEVDKICNGLGISQDQRVQDFASLSGGEKTRVNLARLLLEKTELPIGFLFAEIRMSRTATIGVLPEIRPIGRIHIIPSLETGKMRFLDIPFLGICLQHIFLNRRTEEALL